MLDRWEEEDCDDFDGCEHGVGFDEDCERCEDDQIGCLFPETCIMPGIHVESECHTAEMMKQWMEAEEAAQNMRSDRTAALGSD